MGNLRANYLPSFDLYEIVVKHSVLSPSKHAFFHIIILLLDVFHKTFSLREHPIFRCLLYLWFLNLGMQAFIAQAENSKNGHNLRGVRLQEVSL
jgi:hypothetical protein